jgi:hypothetical protein
LTLNGLVHGQDWDITFMMKFVFGVFVSASNPEAWACPDLTDSDGFKLQTTIQTLFS